MFVRWSSRSSILQELPDLQWDERRRIHLQAALSQMASEVGERSRFARLTDSDTESVHSMLAQYCFL